MTPFDTLALATFRYQAQHCPPYRKYLELLGVEPGGVGSLEQVPYLPVEFFKSYRVYDRQCAEPEVVFESSGTTGAQTSRHFVASAGLYRRAFTRAFKWFYGAPQRWSIFALLPGYAQRPGSSLIYMVEQLRSENPTKGGFYLEQYGELAGALREAARNGERILLIGVAFALLDFAEYLGAGTTPLRLPADAVVMETGGMKGRRREVQREELHRALRGAFAAAHIHSEYGMTELLSQAYSSGDGVFRCPPWMRVTLRDLQSPLRPIREVGRQGGINVIDLANRHSCSFLAIGDRGQLVDSGGGFRVLGRIAGAQLRGCNMLLE